MLDNVHAEPESEIQEEQSSGEYGGPRASSCEEANISFFLSKAIPGASHHLPWLLFVLNYYLYAMLDWYRSCILVILLNYP
jgi:hypothetical protein